MTGNRVAALDLLRGIAVAGMILVVSPGDWARTYPPLRHAAWNGWMLADMVFPAFLVAVGVAVGLSFPRDWGAGAAARFRRRLGRRVVALLVLGLLVEASYVWCISAGAPFPGEGGLAHVRLPGILQRIALCYGLGAAIAIATARRGDGRATLRPAALALAAAALLVGYWAAMLLVPVPGGGSGHLDPAGNLAAFIDRGVFGVAHLWPLGWATPDGPVVYDPEGLLSSLPATANVLIGVIAGWAIRTRPGDAARPLLIAGIALFALGWLLDPVVVVNKRIWTPSFSMLSTGFAIALLGALVLAERQRPLRAVLAPFRVLGGNAILAFVLATVMSRLAGFAIVPTPHGPATPQAWGFAAAQRFFADPYLASLSCAVGVVALVTLLVWPLHRRAVHFRL